MYFPSGRFATISRPETNAAREEMHPPADAFWVRSSRHLDPADYYCCIGRGIPVRCAPPDVFVGEGVLWRMIAERTDRKEDRARCRLGSTNSSLNRVVVKFKAIGLFPFLERRLIISTKSSSDEGNMIIRRRHYNNYFSQHYFPNYNTTQT